MGARSSGAPQVHRDVSRSSRRPARLLFLARRLGVSDATSGRGGQTQGGRHERSARRCDPDVAETALSAFVRVDLNRDAGVGATLSVARIFVDGLLDLLQFSILHHAQHRVPGEQCGTYVRHETV